MSIDDIAPDRIHARVETDHDGFRQLRIAGSAHLADDFGRHGDIVIGLHTETAIAELREALAGVDDGARDRLQRLSELVVDVAAILDRRHPATLPYCQCADCRTARETTIECGTCGYHGHAATLACRCEARRAKRVRIYRQILAEVDGPIPPDERRELTVKLLEVRRRGAEALCDRGDGSGCEHGSVVCPVCVTLALGDFHSPSERAAWRIVRAVREQFTAAGVAFR